MATFDMSRAPEHVKRAIAAADAKQASKVQQQKAKTSAAVLAAVGKRTPVVGRVELVFKGEPPTVTHQAKVIGRRGRSGKACLRDSQELLDAAEALAAGIPFNTGKTILATPIAMSAQFVWPHDFGWYEEKPDLDNALKTLTDVLVKRGWIPDDKAVVRLRDCTKTRGPKPGIYILLETCDSRLPLIYSGKTGVIVPRDEAVRPGPALPTASLGSGRERWDSSFGA
jgi:Holliday junction resolvase RusA-like endonuclease